MNSIIQIEYVADADVGEELDRELRELLSSCFTKPQDHVFRRRRYFHEMPAHRWVVRDERGELAAHVAVHDKAVFDETGACYRIGGIAEVCVRADQQGRGHVKRLLATAHVWMRAEGFSFSVLSGNPRYYASSGYREVANLWRNHEDVAGSKSHVPFEGAMVATLSETPWPSGAMRVPGQVF